LGLFFLVFFFVVDELELGLFVLKFWRAFPESILVTVGWSPVRVLGYGDSEEVEINYL
jgi:hypothetical protein